MRWTTHVPRGLTERDVLMAEYCDVVAGRLGETEVEGVKEGDGGEKGRELVDRVAGEGIDCKK